MSLNFEEYEEENFGHELPTVWMRITNLPRVLRKYYEVLWAIGSMFGATQKVDMHGYHKEEQIWAFSSRCAQPIFSSQPDG